MTFEAHLNLSCSTDTNLLHCQHISPKLFFGGWGGGELFPHRAGIKKGKLRDLKRPL